MLRLPTDDPCLDQGTPLAEGQRPRPPRVKTDCTALLDIGGRAESVSVLDISLAGAKLALRGAADPQNVSLTLPGLGTREGVLRWGADGRAGIAFNEPLHLQELTSWLRSHQRRIGRAVLRSFAFLTVALAHPAAAAGVRSSMTVGAVVPERCAVSLRSSGVPTIVCSPGTRGPVAAVSRKPQPPRRRARAVNLSPAAEPQLDPEAGQSYFTVTY